MPICYIASSRKLIHITWCKKIEFKEPVMYRNKHVCLTFWSTEVNTEERSERGECLSYPEFKFEMLSKVELKCLFFIQSKEYQTESLLFQ